MRRKSPNSCKTVAFAVPAALAVMRGEPLPVYQALRSLHDAEIFFSVGFLDTDAWFTADTARFNLIPRPELSYLYWLAKHGGISCQPSVASAKDIYTAHVTFRELGRVLLAASWERSLILDQIVHTKKNSESPPSPPLDDCIAWIHTVHTATLPADIADAYHCQCSPGGCTPLKSLLKETVKYTTFEYKLRLLPEYSVTDYGRLITGFILYLEHYWCHLEVRHHIAALRFMTYTALGIPRSCCERGSHGMSEDEFKEEHAYNLELPEELLHEFEGELIAILQDPDPKITNLTDFWERTWTGRMTEVQDRLNGSDLRDDERRTAEEIGVLWDKPRPEPSEVMGNTHRPNTLDY